MEDYDSHAGTGSSSSLSSMILRDSNTIDLASLSYTNDVEIWHTASFLFRILFFLRLFFPEGSGCLAPEEASNIRRRHCYSLDIDL